MIRVKKSICQNITMLFEQNKNISGRRVVSYDIIRILAFILVVISHVAFAVAHKYGHEMCPLLYTGNLGVSLFIVLSGCSLSISSGKTKIINFYKKRFLSIYPSYWTAYILVFLFLFAFMGILSIGNKPWHLIYTLIAQDGYLSTKYLTYYLVGEWFTGFIVLVYLVAPAIIAGMRRIPAATLIITLLLSYLSIRYNTQLYNHLPIWNNRILWNPTARLFEFAAGAGISNYLINNPKRLIICSILSVLGLITFCILKQSFLQASFEETIIGVMLMIVFVCLFEIIPVSEGILQKIRFLSKYSFAAFLFHHQIINLIINRTTYPQPDATLIVSSIITVLIFSYWAGYYSEKPAGRLRNLLKQKLLQD